MQRKFLEDLGLAKDVIDKIMTENGNDINNAKKKLEAERDNYKEQLALSIASKIDADSMDALQTAQLNYDGSASVIKYAGIVDSIDLFNYGGDNTGYQIPFNIHYCGDRVKGTFDTATKTFTPETTESLNYDDGE